MPAPSSSLTKLVRDGLERACKDFSTRVAPLGFRRTRKHAWTRQKDGTEDLIDLHREGSTYGAPRDASVGIRITLWSRRLAAGAQSILGPQSDAGTTRSGRYHLRFNARSWSTYDRCIEDLVRFVQEVGEPWFTLARSGAGSNPGSTPAAP